MAWPGFAWLALRLLPWLHCQLVGASLACFLGQPWRASLRPWYRGLVALLPGFLACLVARYGFLACLAWLLAWRAWRAWLAWLLVMAWPGFLASWRAWLASWRALAFGYESARPTLSARLRYRRGFGHVYGLRLAGVPAHCEACASCLCACLARYGLACASLARYGKVSAWLVPTS